MNEKTTPVFSLEGELMTVTTFSFKTKKSSIGHTDLSGQNSKNFYKKIDLSFLNLDGFKTLTIIHKNVDLSLHLKQLYSW